MGTRKLCRGHEILCRGLEILCRGNEILSRGNEIIMSWERDHMSWERDKYFFHMSPQCCRTFTNKNLPFIYSASRTRFYIKAYTCIFSEAVDFRHN